MKTEKEREERERKERETSRIREAEPLAFEICPNNIDNFDRAL